MSSSLSVSALVAQYGYWMVFFGALAEGESVLLTAGFAAHRGLLQLPQVIALAFAAGTLGDQLAFHLGRRFGPRLLASRPSLARQAQRLQPLLLRHPRATILSLRFAYGLRIAGPIALGALGVPRWTFVWLNMLGAALWATGFSLLGWQFGSAMQWLLRDLHALEDAIIVALLVGGLVLALWWRLHRRPP